MSQTHWQKTKPAPRPEHPDLGAIAASYPGVRIDEQKKQNGNGNRDEQRLKQLDEMFRATIAPNVPSYDVNKVQPVDFDEWCYTDGLNCLWAQTQNVEINTRLMHEALNWTGPIDDHAAFLAKNVTDKWKLGDITDEGTGRFVFFPPGSNAKFIINTDNVVRAFETDRRWMIKPHPITHPNDTRATKLSFGITRMIPPDKSGMTVLRNCAKVGYTTASELGLIAMCLGKPVVDFTRYGYANYGTYYPIYHALDTVTDKVAGLNRIMSCPWSGLVPVTVDDTEAKKRFAAFYRKSIQLREKHKPLTPPLQHMPEE